MNAFIVRPFGEKNGIDFDKVEADLIRPALAALKIPGGTTGLLAYAGNIRTDMFEQLLLADVVIADISIHNANVFYELGVRHGLRDRRTYMIRCKGDEVPFDLKTDRYLEYDRDKPAETLPQLIEGLRQTLASDRQDSPVFLLLPKLEPPSREALLTVPEDFELEVRRAHERKQPGDLALLAAEAHGFQWEVEGLRTVGRALFKLGANAVARGVWVAVLAFDPDDIEALLLLGTIYERLKDIAASDTVLEKVLGASALTPKQRAEAFALLGRNAKRRWQKSWENEDKPAGKALQSKALVEAQEQYARGYSEDQNEFFPGLNALALLTVRLELARALPDAWDAQFDESEEAQAALMALEKLRTKLAAAVEQSLEAAAARHQRAGTRDIWLDFSQADFKCLTLNKPPRVAAAYQAIMDGADPFAISSGRGQLEIYARLGILSANVAAALAVFPPAPPVEKGKAPLKVLLFTGHQMDSPGRTKTKPARFPAEKEAVARERIKEEIVRAWSGSEEGPKLGLAGAASGGDILFHEVCAELGIPTHVYLALPENMFINESVAPADGNWEARFRNLLASKNRETEVRRLAEGPEMPKWLASGKPDYKIWERNNLWMLHNAIALGGEHTTLIALWDGEGGDGPGGTRDMVEQARKLGARTTIINTKEAFGLATT
ncbi:MAG: tetratricopeptide repeat-containing protein [Chthoniobacteraceae bacterium]